jgi:hypothetical protein
MLVGHNILVLLLMINNISVLTMDTSSDDIHSCIIPVRVHALKLDLRKAFVKFPRPESPRDVKDALPLTVTGLPEKVVSFETMLKTISTIEEALENTDILRRNAKKTDDLEIEWLEIATNGR